MNNLRHAQERRNSLLKEATSVLTASNAERRDTTSAENERLARIKSEILDCDQTIARCQAEIRTATTGPNGFSRGENRDIEKFSISRAIRQLADGGRLDGIEGEMHAEGRNQAASVGIKCQGNLTVPLFAMESRDMTATLQTSAAGDQGGDLIQTDLMATVPLLYRRTVLHQLGARFMPNLIGNVGIPRLITGATAAHAAEVAALTESSPTTDQIQMSPNKLGTFVEISKQLLIQSDFTADRLVRDDIYRALVGGIEQGALTGTGADNQPMGLLHDDAGIDITSVVGGTDGLAPTLDHVIDLETAVAALDGDQGRLAYLTNSKVRGRLKKTAIASEHPLKVWQTGATPLNGYAAAVSNHCPSDLDKGSNTGVASAILFGNWDDLVIGTWGGIDIMANPYIKDIEGLVRITASVFYDTAIRRAASFAAMRDALTA